MKGYGIYGQEKGHEKERIMWQLLKSRLFPLRRLRGNDKATYTLITQTPLFAGMSMHSLSLLIPHIQTRRYKQSEVVFFRGDPARALYVVQSGVVQGYLDRFMEKDERLFEAERGTLLDCHAIWPHTYRLVNTVVTSSEATLLVLPQKPLINFMRAHFSHRVLLMQRCAQGYYKEIEDIYRRYCESADFFQMGHIVSQKTSK